jgi:hypothetical protein
MLTCSFRLLVMFDIHYICNFLTSQIFAIYLRKKSMSHVSCMILQCISTLTEMPAGCSIAVLWKSRPQFIVSYIRLNIERLTKVLYKTK